jgi:hypothetical protein
MKKEELTLTEAIAENFDSIVHETRNQNGISIENMAKIIGNHFDWAEIESLIYQLLVVLKDKECSDWHNQEICKWHNFIKR